VHEGKYRFVWVPARRQRLIEVRRKQPKRPVCDYSDKIVEHEISQSDPSSPIISKDDDVNLTIKIGRPKKAEKALVFDKVQAIELCRISSRLAGKNCFFFI
jgi:hypothetical protein